MLLCEENQSGCYLSDKELNELYGYLFNAINPRVYYNESAMVMTREALHTTLNNLKHLLKLLQAATPSEHPIQEELAMLLGLVEDKTMPQPPALKRKKHVPD